MQTWLKLKQWFLNHKLDAHIFVVVWGILQGAYAESPAFHAGVNAEVKNIYQALPKGIAGIIMTIVVPLILYWNTQKKTTATATISPGDTGTATATATAKDNQ